MIACYTILWEEEPCADWAAWPHSTPTDLCVMPSGHRNMWEVGGCPTDVVSFIQQLTYAEPFHLNSFGKEDAESLMKVDSPILPGQVGRRDVGNF